ncbi:MAG: hypothetical protein AUG51_09790 [Acidobacteria bacterium 13_1_20CM_3_53_8]|nr:MAG: hypothetical protein AUG51_09790 [Acidobacteria bacterium 13_1_20CM_3_53_8]
MTPELNRRLHEAHKQLGEDHERDAIEPFTFDVLSTLVWFNSNFNLFRSYAVERKAQALSVPPAVAGGY